MESQESMDFLQLCVKVFEIGMKNATMVLIKIPVPNIKAVA